MMVFIAWKKSGDDITRIQLEGDHDVISLFPKEDNYALPFFETAKDAIIWMCLHPDEKCQVDSSLLPLFGADLHNVHYFPRRAA